MREPFYDYKNQLSVLLLPKPLAPEHLQGRPDKRSDVYALGVILYQMLTGRVPFEGSTPALIMIKHLNEPPPPLHTLRPDLPPALENTINKALAKDQAARPATAGQLLAEFRAAVEGLVVGPYATTRVSSIYSDPTLRVQPPKSTVPEQLLQELEELKAVVHKLAETTPKPPPESALPTPGPAPDASPSQQAQLWTRGFLALFAAITTLGGLVIFLTSLHAEEGQAVFFLLTSAVVGLCGYGLHVARAPSTSVGFLLQASAAAITTLVFLAALLSGGDAAFRDFFGLPLVVVTGVLNSLSLIFLAYGIAPWKPRALTGVLLVPVIVSSGLLIYSMAGGDVLSVALLICALSSPVVFLVRPQLWRQELPLTLLVVLGELGVLISYYAFYYRYGLIPYFGVGFRIGVGADQPIYAVFFVSYFLVLLAFVLVVQTERVQKRAQEAALAA